MPVKLSGKLDGSRAQGTVDAEATIGGGTIKASGNYAKAAAGMTYRLDLSAKQDDPVPLMRAFGLSYDPAGPLNGASLDATLNGQPNVARLENLRLAMGKAQLDGVVTLDSTGERPKLSAQLQGGDVNLNAFLPPATTGVAQVKAVQSQSAIAKARVRWSRDPMDWSLIRDNDAEIRVAAKSITYGPYVFTGPSLMVIAKDGVLKVDPLAAGLFGGTATIRLTADATKTPKLDITTELKEVDVAQLSAASMGNQFATGKVGMNGQFTASGESQFDIVKSLNGLAQLQAHDGVIEKVDLPALSERLNAMRTMNDFLATASAGLSGGQTPYREVGGEVAVQNGMARAQNVKSDIESAKADLVATADLPNWRLDALASFTLTDVPGAPPVTVSLKGPIDSPVRELGTKQLQNYFVGRLGAAVLRDAIGKQEGGLGELLGTTTQPTGTSSEPANDNQTDAEEPLKPFQLLFDQLRKKKETD
jgi:AsmA protein